MTTAAPSETITINTAKAGAYVVTLPIEFIKVGNRFRQDHGDLDSLAASIKELGLLQPIGVDRDHNLIFGHRRYLAHQLLGRGTIQARIIEVPSLLQAERDENELRKDFTHSERVAIAEAIKAEIGNRQGQRTDKTKLLQNFAEVAPGQTTREAVAKAAGFGNAETYRQAMKVVEKAEPALVSAMDKEDISISTAAKLAEAAPEIQREAAANPKAAPRLAKEQQQDDALSTGSRSNLEQSLPSPWVKGGRFVSRVIEHLGYIKGKESELTKSSQRRLIPELKGALARLEKAMEGQP